MEGRVRDAPPKGRGIQRYLAVGPLTRGFYTTDMSALGGEAGDQKKRLLKNPEKYVLPAIASTVCFVRDPCFGQKRKSLPHATCHERAEKLRGPSA